MSWIFLFCSGFLPTQQLSEETDDFDFFKDSVPLPEERLAKVESCCTVLEMGKQISFLLFSYHEKEKLQYMCVLCAIQLWKLRQLHLFLYPKVQESSGPHSGMACEGQGYVFNKSFFWRSEHQQTEVEETCPYHNFFLFFTERM